MGDAILAWPKGPKLHLIVEKLSFPQENSCGCVCSAKVLIFEDPHPPAKQKGKKSLSIHFLCIRILSCIELRSCVQGQTKNVFLILSVLGSKCLLRRCLGYDNSINVPLNFDFPPTFFVLETNPPQPILTKLGPCIHPAGL